MQIESVLRFSPWTLKSSLEWHILVFTFVSHCPRSKNWVSSCFTMRCYTFLEELINKKSSIRKSPLNTSWSYLDCYDYGITPFLYQSIIPTNNWSSNDDMCAYLIFYDKCKLVFGNFQVNWSICFGIAFFPADAIRILDAVSSYFLG